MKQDVIKRILETVRNKNLRDELIRKVQNGEDLSLSETKMIYGPVEFGTELQMTKKRPIDIDWTDHAEYRGELRDIDTDNMNESVKEKVKTKFLKDPKSKGKEKFKGQPGTAVVEFDTRENPANADIVTTWASQPTTHLIFATEDKALQYLANVTGLRIKVAAEYKTIYRGDHVSKAGNFWSFDPDFAAQFTRTGQHKELKIRRIKVSDIYLD